MPRENERRKARALAQEKIIQSLCLRLCLCLRRGHFYGEMRVMLVFVLTLGLVSLVKTRLLNGQQMACFTLEGRLDWYKASY